MTTIPEGSTLLPCPFCGGEARLELRDMEPQGDSWYGKRMGLFPMCTGCGCCLFDGFFHEAFDNTDSEFGRNAAIAAWNRRALSASGGAEAVAQYSHFSRQHGHVWHTLVATPIAPGTKVYFASHPAEPSALASAPRATEATAVHRSMLDLAMACIAYAGPFDDPRVGWTGTGATGDCFRCERCGAEDLDCRRMEHVAGCSAKKLLDALDAVHKETER